MNVQLSLAGQSSPRTSLFETFIDSGASRCLFPASTATQLGLDLESGLPTKTGGITGLLPVWVHDVTLHIAGESLTIPAGFAPHMTSAGLLGLTGFFSNFDVTFDSVLRECRFERRTNI